MTMVVDTLEPETVTAQEFEIKQRWRLPTRIAFRFFAVYFTCYVLLTQMFNGLVNLPWVSLPSPEDSRIVRAVVTWVATQILGLRAPLVIDGSGSGDKPYDYAFAFTFLVLAAVVTAVWSIADRRRLAYPGVQKWFRLFLRFGLGTTMLSYGVVKVFPLQMSYPGLTRLIEPYGHFSLMGVLWAKIGASPAYEMLTGAVEVACAILLFIPGLTTAGAMLSLMASTQIFALNMTYDVPVKLFSFHLILMSLMLLAPDLRRLARAILLRRAVDAAPEPALARSVRRRRALVALQLVFGAWVVFDAASGARESWQSSGGGAPRPPLYGIWQIDRMTINGVERAPLVTDYERWRRLVVQNTRTITFQRMDDTFQGFSAAYDSAARTIILNAGGPPPARELGRFTFEQPSPDRLVLDGKIGRRSFRFETSLVDRSQFRLVQGRFRWMQDYPFNR